jgi:hypothetical protein
VDHFELLIELGTNLKIYYKDRDRSDILLIVISSIINGNQLSQFEQAESLRHTFSATGLCRITDGLSQIFKVFYALSKILLFGARPGLKNYCAPSESVLKDSFVIKILKKYSFNRINQKELKKMCIKKYINH